MKYKHEKEIEEKFILFSKNNKLKSDKEVWWINLWRNGILLFWISKLGPVKFIGLSRKKGIMLDSYLPDFCNICYLCTDYLKHIYHPSIHYYFHDETYDLFYDEPYKNDEI